MPIKAKLVMRDDRTGLPIGPDGQLIVRSVKDAQKIVAAAGKVQDEIAEIRSKYKLGMLEAELENHRKCLKEFQTENEITEISAEGFVSGLVERKKSFWVWDSQDIPDRIVLEDDVVPLKEVIKRKYRDLKRRGKVTAKITKRIIVPAALDEFVRGGGLAAEDVENSLAEYIETTYVQIKPDKVKK